MKKIILALLILFNLSKAIAQVCEGNLLLNQNFENGINAGWTAVNVDGLPIEQKHIDRGFADTFNEQKHFARNCAGSSSYVSGGVACDDFLISPLIAAPAGNLCLSWQAANYNGYFFEYFEVYVSAASNNPADLIAAGPMATYTVDTSANWFSFSLDLSAYANHSFYIAFRHFNSYGNSALFIDDIKLVQPYATDLALKTTSVAKIILPSTINPTVNVCNGGLQNITSFTVNRSLNNGIATSQTFNQTITPGSCADVVLSQALNIPVNGTYVIKQWLSNVNGGADLNQNNDSLSVTVYASNYPRKILAEEFTQASCPPCAIQNPAYQALLAPYRDNGQLLQLKYQTSWPGYDPMYLDNPGECESRVFYYGIPYVPSVRTNGDVLNLYDSTGGYFLPGYVSTVTQPYLDSMALLSSMFEINVSQQVLANAMNVAVTVHALSDINNEILTLQCAIMEDTVDFGATPPGTNGETVFYQVMRKMLPDEYGTAVPALTAGQQVTYNFTYFFNGCATCNYSKLKSIAFIQDETNQQIYQCAIAGGTVGITENLSDNSVLNLYPNPSSGIVHVKLPLTCGAATRLIITDATGRVVKSSTFNKHTSTPLTFNVDGLSAGVYFANVIADNSVLKAKLTVK